MTRLYRLQRIFREIFDDPNLVLSSETSAATLRDWDSVATVQIAIATEAEFRVRFTTDEVAELRSVADLLRFLDVHGAE